jgi:hypothetical protein
MAITIFDVGLVSLKDTGNAFTYWKRAADLTGMPWSVSEGSPGFWTIHFIAESPSDDTIFNTPAFQLTYYPEGAKENPAESADWPAIRVYYGVSGVSLDAQGQLSTLAGATVDPDAGYTVFRLTTGDIKV